MPFIDTDPVEVSWDELYYSNNYHIRVQIRAIADRKASRIWTHNIDLTKFYSYCKITDINLLGHTIDRVGNNNRCVLSFYFMSDSDKAHFILKFK